MRSSEVFLFCRSRDEADAKLWEEHVQEDQYRPSVECPSPLCEKSNYSPVYLISGRPAVHYFVIRGVDNLAAHFIHFIHYVKGTF